MEDAIEVELLIHQKRQEGQAAFSIADDLLKTWAKNGLTPAAKLICGRFCFFNGFYISVIEALRHDLLTARPLCWPLVFELIKKKDRALIQAMHDGAERDKQSLALAIAALAAKDIDTRWKPILLQELKEKESNMSEMRVAAQIPQAPNIKKAPVKKDEGPIELRLRLAKERLSKMELNTDEFADRPLQASQAWPGLEEELRKKSKTLDMASCTELAVALHMMSFEELAVKVLRRHKKTWGRHQELLQLEFLVSGGAYLEAIQEAELLLKASPQDPDVLYPSLYAMALSHAGLKDFSKALDILKALALHQPEYRNIQSLIKKWKSPGNV